MARGSHRGATLRKGATVRRRSRFSWWPAVRTRRRWRARWRQSSPAARLLLGVLAAAAVAVVLNTLYQVMRKPTELFFPVSGVLYKTPDETWRDYAALFRRYATAAIPPQLLAALAQVEASGNPLVRTYWKWSWSPQPFELYRPASSAVGMYQITDGTFAQARHFCIHAHHLVREGAWNQWDSCWFNRLYLRVSPGDAVELTAAYLDLQVTQILARYPVAAQLQTQHLAAVVHLCGAGGAESYARHGFRFGAGERCGDHDPRVYLKRVDAMSRVFAQLAAGQAPDGGVQ
jgi:hypothetical protein